MKALYLSNDQLSYRPTCRGPVLPAGEALVDVSLAGICGTDLELARGYAGFEGIPGHEFVGRVRSAPTDPQWVGTRVVADINVGCGNCRRCAAGRPHHCAARRVIGIRDRPGCFAQQIAVPIHNLVEVPDHVADEQAVFAEPLAAALGVSHLLEPDSGPVLVIGAGRLGQLIIRVLVADGRDCVAACRHEAHRRLAEAAGAAVVTEAQLKGDSFDTVVDSSGHPEALNVALEAVSAEGCVILKSTCARPAAVDTAVLVVKEVRLLGSRCGSISEALQVLEQGLVDPQPLIDLVAPLSRGVEAFERAATGGALKVLLEPPSECGR